MGGALLDESAVEALMVLLGTDPRRLLVAVGLHAATADAGALTILAEAAVHHDRIALDVAALAELGAARWREAVNAVRASCPDLLATPAADPRAALPVLADRLADVLPGPVTATTAGLVAACLIEKARLDEHLALSTVDLPAPDGAG